MVLSRRATLTVAWTGAAAFAASLGWFVYCYLFVFGVPPPPGDRLLPIGINVLLFSVFALHHSVLARSGAKAVVRRVLPSELERSAYAWVSSVIFLAVCTWWQPVPGVLYELHGSWRAIGWTVQLAGIVLTIRASRRLDVLDLAGVRAVERSGRADRGEAPVLNTGGLYGFVRHPLYFSWVLFVFGTPTMTGTRASFAVISTLYLMLAIPFEERGLVETFGSDYNVYRQRVRTRMIPWIY
jgi:methanethiol S-methyltransferase